MTSHIRVWALAALVSACGSEPGGQPDAATPGTFALEVLDPPGDSIGLPPLGQVALRVVLKDDSGRPVADADVSFAFVASASESTGGATLSAEVSQTDAMGIATANLVAGADRVNFRVEVSSPSAPPVFFYLAISEGGFTDVRVTPIHVGPRLAEEYRSVQLRLYRSRRLRCADLDIDHLPQNVLSPRELDSFGPSVDFVNLSAGEAFTVVAWAQLTPGSQTRAAVGCLDLTAGQLRSDRIMQAAIAVIDRPLQIPDELELASVIDLSPLATALPGAALWSALACPLGPAQLVIDCAVDAQVDDGALDCTVEGTGDLVDDIEAVRGAPDTQGCRPATIASGQPSLDQLIADTQAGSPWPSDTGLSQFLSARDAILSELQLRSRLSSLGPSLASHRLLQAEMVSPSGEAFTVDLPAANRPVLQVDQVGLSVSAVGAFAMSEHSFTLRLGDIADAAYLELALEPAGLSSRSADLGSALLESLQDGPADGCDVVDTITCDAIERAAGCLSSCPSLLATLDDALSEWLVALDTSGLDLTMSGAGGAEDDDGDLVVNTIGEDDSAHWAIVLLLTGDVPVPLEGTFASAPAVP